MQRWQKTWLATGLGLLAAGCGGAAQNAQPRPRVIAINATDPRPAPTDDRQLSPAETLQLIDEDAALVQRQLIRARALHEPQRAACLDDALSELHADGRNAGDQAQALKKTVQANDAVGTREHRVMLDVMRRRAERLTQQADRCGARLGGTRVARPDPLAAALHRERATTR